jgi:hypothetical protein
MYSCFENKTEDGKESQIMYCRKLSILILYHFFLKIPIDCCCLGGGGGGGGGGGVGGGVCGFGVGWGA